MQSLTDDFNELVLRIQQGRELNYASFEPIYYLVFPAREIIEVKRQVPVWVANLKNRGWTPVVFSIAEAIESILANDSRRTTWLMMDRKNPLNWEPTNKSLGNALQKPPKLQEALETAISEASNLENGIVLVTDLEALHPYLRIGAIESRLQEKFTVPTIFLYPGTRAGKTSLRFLGFYEEDGNYRSVHVGRTL